MDEKQLADLVLATIDKRLDEFAKNRQNKSIFDIKKGRIDMVAKGFRELRDESPETVVACVKFGRFVKGIALAGLYGAQTATSMIKELHPDDPDTLSSLNKALGVTVSSDGGFTVDSVLIAEMIPYLYSKLAVTKLGARRLPMPKGNATIPRIDTKSTFSWIGENKIVPKSQQVLGAIKLIGKKGGAIVPVSNDLLRSADIAADLWITQDVVISLQLALDYAALYGTGTEFQPSGLTKLLPSAQQIGSASTVMTADIPGSIKGQLMAANVPMINLGWIINGWMWSWLFNLKTTTGAYIYREEMSQGKLLGDPFVISNQLSVTNPTGYGSTMYTDLFFGDWSEFIWAEQLAMEITASREATYYDGANNVSAFANDQTVIRALTVVDFNLRHTASFIRGTYKLAAS